jgi:molybdenum cofactor synthesis domain-containing protein
VKIVAETAAALVIGNELLSGKIQETNLLELSRLLRALGIGLLRAVIVPDDVHVISRELDLLRNSADVVFTSGGIGPTHDDVTVQAVAHSFGVEAVLDRALEGMLREVYGERCTDAHLRMAMIPQGARLLATPDVRWPTPLIGNVFILPGVPEIFRAKLDVVRAHLSGPSPFTSKAVFLRLDEAELTQALDQVVAKHPEVEVGSYPKWFEPRYKTKVTFDGRNPEAVDRALADFVGRFDAEAIAGVD